MLQVASEMLSRLREALPEATVYWEKEPGDRFKGAVLTAELKHRKFTLQFDSKSDGAETIDGPLVDQVVDDFVDFFARSIYPKEKFTRML